MLARWPAVLRETGLHPSRPEDLLYLDIDLRIGVDGWTQVWGIDDWDDEQLAAVLRFAYGRGYLEALTEPERGKLCRDHGFAVPSRGIAR
jgi:hypothetical protein